MQTILRRASRLGLALAFTFAAAPGCRSLGLRQPHAEKDPEVARASGTTPGSGGGDEVESNKILDVQSEPSKPKSFFRPSRLPGGLSDESREIEGHLGIR